MTEEVKLLRGEIESWRERLHQREKEEEMEPPVDSRERQDARPARAQSDPRSSGLVKMSKVIRAPVQLLEAAQETGSP